MPAYLGPEENAAGQTATLLARLRQFCLPGGEETTCQVTSARVAKGRLAKLPGSCPKVPFPIFAAN